MERLLRAQPKLPQRIIQILLDDQQADGLFLGYSTPSDHPFGADAKVYKTTFAPALILGALAETQDDRIKVVQGRATDWLLAQRGPEWSFNYWAREAPETQSRPYPDDWDDTSCAIIALTRTRPEAVTGEVLGNIVTLLTNTEMAEGGPYRTWIVPADAPEHWQDVDIAVNANIAYMLQLHGVDLPKLEQLADAQIAGGELRSPYYPSAYPIEYFLSRWYNGVHREQLLKRILERQQHGRWGNPLDTALAVSACLNLGGEPTSLAPAAEWLRKLGDQELRPYAFCLDPAIEGRSYLAGSRALTAAFCLEALAKYDTALQVTNAKATTATGTTASRSAAAAPDAAAVSNPAPAPAPDEPGRRLHERVVAHAMERFESTGPDISAAAQRMHDRLLGSTAASQITLLPYVFRQALGKDGHTISDERLVTLGTISFYGWLAYTVYDDFLDEEGEPPLLPLANVAMRELVLALNREAGTVTGFEAMVWPVLDRQEAANAWEVSHCRVRHQSELRRVSPPDFTDRHVLAERSMGHALGCLAITAELGYAIDSAQMQAVAAFFYHFLIARQLSDDVCDWKADLQNGQVNAVGSHLLAGVKRRGATVGQLYIRLDRYFWETGLGDINGWINHELSQARATLAEATFVKRPEVLEALLQPLEEAIQKSQLQQQQTTEFLRAYHPES